MLFQWRSVKQIFEILPVFIYLQSMGQIFCISLSGGQLKFCHDLLIILLWIKGLQGILKNFVEVLKNWNSRERSILKTLCPDLHKFEITLPFYLPHLHCCRWLRNELTLTFKMFLFAAMNQEHWIQLGARWLNKKNWIMRDEFGIDFEITSLSLAS